MSNLLEEIAVEIYPDSSISALQKLDDLRKIQDRMRELREEKNRAELSYRQQLKSIDRMIDATQLTCHHERKKRHHDPSGGNDSHDECLICGKVW